MATKKKSEEAGGRPQTPHGAQAGGDPRLTTSKTIIPDGLDRAFKNNPTLKLAYVAGENWQFDEKIAKGQFTSYAEVKNPYLEEKD